MESEVLLDISPLSIVRIEPKPGGKCRWPCILVSSRDAASDHEHVDQIIAVFRSQLQSKRPYVTIFDCRMYRYPTMMQVYNIWQFVRSMKEEFNEYLMCSVVIQEDNLWSVAGNSLMELVRLLNQTNSPFLVCHDMEAAEEFIDSVGDKADAIGRRSSFATCTGEAAFVNMTEFRDFEDEGEATTHSRSGHNTSDNQYYQKRDLKADLGRLRDEKTTRTEPDVIIDVPCVCITFGAAHPDERALFMATSRAKPVRTEDPDNLEAAMDSILDKNEEFLAIYDIRDFKIPPMALVYRFGGYITKRDADFARLLKCTGVVLGDNFWSAAARKIVDLMTSLNPPPCPMIIAHELSVVHDFFAEHDVKRKPLESGGGATRSDANRSSLPSSRRGSVSMRFLSVDSFRSFEDDSDNFLSFTPAMRQSTFFSAPEVWNDRMCHSKSADRVKIESVTHEPDARGLAACMSRGIRRRDQDDQPATEEQCTIL